MAKIYHVKTKTSEVKTTDIKMALSEVEKNLEKGIKMTVFSTEGESTGWLSKLVENAFPGDIKVAYNKVIH